MSVGVFLFHRDLRLEDHFPLQKALNKGTVIPVFIFTPEQASSSAPVRSLKSLACLVNSLKDLSEDLIHKFHTPLHLMYNDVIQGLNQIFSHTKISFLVETKDYTPYAKLREEAISDWCDRHSVEYEAIDDLYLFAPGFIRNKSGKIYQKFTPYYEAASKHSVPKPTGFVKGHFTKIPDGLSFKEIESKLFKNESPGPLYLEGGRKEGLKLLESLPSNYNSTHDMIPVETSGLSVHHHYGTISIRETYWTAKGRSKLTEFVRQLFWRDFYGQIIAFFEELYGENPYNFQTDWAPLTAQQIKDYNDWCNGTTGIPIIDASMHELNQNGRMHNRLRLVTASWLVKTANVPWRFGEQYFANHLLDYDFTQNFCNWIMISPSRLPFSEPPFRKHTPENYQRRFDPDKEYVNQWL